MKKKKIKKKIFFLKKKKILYRWWMGVWRRVWLYLLYVFHWKWWNSPKFNFSTKSKENREFCGDRIACRQFNAELIIINMFISIFFLSKNHYTLPCLYFSPFLHHPNLLPQLLPLRLRYTNPPYQSPCNENKKKG